MSLPLKKTSHPPIELHSRAKMRASAWVYLSEWIMPGRNIGSSSSCAMDYRRYMAEKNRLDSAERLKAGLPRTSGATPPLPPSLWAHATPASPGGGVSGPVSCRDAATLTDIRRTTQGASRPIRRRTSHREGSDEEPLADSLGMMMRMVVVVERRGL